MPFDLQLGMERGARANAVPTRFGRQEGWAQSAEQDRDASVIERIDVGLRADIVRGRAALANASGVPMLLTNMNLQDTQMMGM